MKRTLVTLSVLALVAGTFLLSGSPGSRTGVVGSVHAQDEFETRSKMTTGKKAHCSNAALAGSFGIMIQGTLLPPNAPVPTSAVAVGSFQVDTAGNVIGSDNLSFGGQILPRAYTGTITVNSDCTISSRLTVNSGPLTGLVINSTGVIVNDSDEIQFVETDPGTIFTAVAKRM